MSISRWEPFSEMMPLRDLMSRLMEESFIMPRMLGPTRELLTTFPVDILESDNDVVVKAAMPGMLAEEIDVRITDNVLTIKGEHREEREQPEQGQLVRQQGQTTAQQASTTTRQQGQMATPQGQMPAYHRREITRGTLYREIVLPTDVQADKAMANFENGILTLTLPKAEQAKAKRIQVQGGTASQGRPNIQRGS